MFIPRESSGNVILAGHANPHSLPGSATPREGLACSLALADDSTSPGGDVGGDRV